MVTAMHDPKAYVTSTDSASWLTLQSEMPTTTALMTKPAIRRPAFPYGRSPDEHISARARLPSVIPRGQQKDIHLTPGKRPAAAQCLAALFCRSTSSHSCRKSREKYAGE